jgi:hypothetical protein
MGKAVEMFHGLFFALPADRTDFGSLLQLLPGIGSVLKSVFYVLVAYAKTMANFSGRFL